MKKISLFSTVIVFAQTLFAQSNLDSIWQNLVVDSYKKYENYTVEIVTNEIIRGKHTKDKGMIDTTYCSTNTTLIYVEPNKFVGVKCENSISFNKNDINTTINFQRKFIAINSLQNYWGNYFNNVSIGGETHFYISILGYPKYFKKIDNISVIGNFLVFECVDSSTFINDIQMYEDVKMYVNKENFLLEKITTKRRNNTIAELGLGAIEREIIINYLEFNSPNSLYKNMFSTDSYSDFSIVKKDNPYLAKNKKTIAKIEREEKKFEKSKITLNQNILNCELVGFENNSIKLNDVKGWILFDIWSKSCFPCFEMMKSISINHQEFEKRGITIVSLNNFEQPNEHLKAFCEKQKINLSELYFFKNKDDIPTFQNEFKIYPSFFLISPDKKVVWQTAGKQSVAELLHEIDKFIK